MAELVWYEPGNRFSQFRVNTDFYFKMQSGAILTFYIDDFVQDCSVSIANAMEILQSCTKIDQA